MKREIHAPNDEYINAAKKLTKDQKERLLCRTGEKLTHKWEKDELDTIAALTIQLEVEEEDLAEWREKMNEIQAKEKSNKKS